MRLVALLAGLVALQAWASDPAGLADNDFGNNGESSVPASAYQPGKKERESKEYKKENPDAAQRNYYEKGGASTNHDSRCRAKIAHRAARYQGPQNGYEAGQSASPVPGQPNHKDGPRPKAGGGKFADAMPTDPDTIIKNIYKYVEDITYPKGQPSDLEHDGDICNLIDNGTLDIGKPRVGNRFMCIETIHLFTSLVRELGFPVREKNVLPSFANGTYDVQTAAANVWYGGEWHFFDPWESFTDSKQYLNSTGHAGYVGPGSFHDADIWIRTASPRVTGSPTEYAFTNRGVPGFSGWKKIKTHKKNGARIETQSFALRLGVQDNLGRLTGGTAAQPANDIPDSIYIAHDRPVQADHTVEPGPDSYEIELITLLYPDDAPPEVLDYQLVAHNPTDTPIPLDVALEGMPASVEVQVTPAQLAALLGPGETRLFPFQVIIGPPLPLPPPAVEGLRVVRNDGTDMTIEWPPVAGAVAYNIYRGPTFFENITDPNVQLIGASTENRFTLPISDGDVVGVESLGPTGISGGLAPEGGSTVAAIVCDIDADDDVDRDDIRLISTARGTRTPQYDPRDANGDRRITVNDARLCVLRCSKPRCAP